MKIPKEVKFIIEKLKENNFQAYIVGGCVRDLLRKVEPEDWDVATNAKPKEIGKIFLKSYLDNKFGTVTVLTGSQDQKLKEIEITPFRIDEKYSDKRHPDKIKWAKTIEEDLARRDFTINAIALKLTEARPLRTEIIDSFEGQKDLKDKIIRAVGKAEDRFSEDALRMLRAVRFATTLDFQFEERCSSLASAKAWAIEEKTAKAIQKNSIWLKMISKERIRDELMKIIMVKKAADGLELLRKLNLLKHIIPELEEGYGVSQNKHHIFECYDHYLKSLKYAAEKDYNKYVRWAALFHDIGKPRTKEGEGPEATFYGHEIVGAKMTAQILNRLKFSKKDIEKIIRLVRYHLFYYNVGEVSESSVRRLVRKVGPENMEELLEVRYCDRIGSGCPKAEPYKLRHLKYLIERVARDPISVKMLKVSGDDVMRILNLKPGPRIGQILDILLGYVLADPQKNKKEFLEKEIKKLAKLSEKEFNSLTQKARGEREKIDMKRDQMTKNKYWVT